MAEEGPDLTNTFKGSPLAAVLKIGDGGQEWKQDQDSGHRNMPLRNDGGLDWTVSTGKITSGWIC